MGIGRTPLQNDPLAYQINWYGKSRLFHNWAEAKAKVYLDFGKEHLWRLIFFHAKDKVGAIGPIPKSIFIQNCHTGTEISLLKREL
ncbi:hypothetical protein [Rheinheimera sp. EpRS3]|uniref:hypothetical protein n=1 Tax=Rheinheimera sp. EpRS3 TaxID=1712383 RepID=UPI00074A22A2|nr:hypothetical protein [Rheinheimera sp. EpRS3]KUM52583.1 hypothetical protein AR688_09850 [Rheinheimera sp. EpRS3]